MQVISTYATTTDALAKAGGPYVVDAGTELTFTGGPPNKPDTQYKWEFGDGATASSMTAKHTYADDGIYVAILTTIVNQPGGSTTREFARIEVRSVKPVVDAGSASSCNEGDVIEYVATFTDREWPDKHTASFDYGDDTPPVAAALTETNSAPLAQGSTRAKHAYCHSGVFTVTVKVMGDDGTLGVATRQVTVRNVPPTVTAHDVFAYPCTPVDLIACFTDPGWCDTHTATWDFGDCTPTQPAIVREHHDPPIGYGTAAATHVYHHCGFYHAVCVVTDDDGASGEAAIVVRVVDVINHDFEGGFRNRLLGTVANGWEPYLTGSGSVGSAMLAGPQQEAAIFSASEYVVHGGQRSQRTSGAGDFHAGIWQSIGANPGWEYQVTVWYHLDERAGGSCRLGVDAAGGTDPASASIVWSKGAEHHNWTQLVVRVNATSHAVTIFLEADGEGRGVAAFFDDVMLAPFPCQLKECPPPKKTSQEICIDWTAQKEPRKLPPTYNDRGFSFRSLVNQPLDLVTWGLPPGQAKLAIPGRGLDILLPYEASRVVARVMAYTRAKLELTARDRAGSAVGNATNSPQQHGIETLEIETANISTLRFVGGENEALLVELCIYVDDPSSPGSPKGTSSKIGTSRSSGSNPHSTWSANAITKTEGSTVSD